MLVGRAGVATVNVRRNGTRQVIDQQISQFQMTNSNPPQAGHVIFRDGLQSTLAFLKSYHQLGSFARTFMLREHAAMLDQLHAGTGQFADHSAEQKDFVEVLIYTELLERLCLTIEDIAKLLHALQFDLKLFLESILTNKNPQNILKELDATKWQTILKYAPIDDLPISPDDRLFLTEVRKRSIAQLDKVNALILRFLDLHWPFFVRHKHGNTILYGLSSTQINGERSFLLPAVFNSNHPERMKGILVNPSIFTKWQVFFNGLVQLGQRLVDRTIVFIETDARPFAEHDTFVPLKPEENRRMEQILRVCNANIRRANVTVNLEATMQTDLLQKFLDFYATFDESLIR